MIDLGRHSVLGTPIDAVDYEAAVDRIADHAQPRRGLACAAIAVHALMTAVHDPQYLYRLQHMGLLVPDGQPVRLSLRLLHGVKLAERVYGPELMLRVCRRCEELGLAVFLFGSTGAVQERLVGSLERQFPNLKIAGARPSRFRTLSSTEADALAREIRDSGASVTFVGLGCPRQEVWAYEFAPLISMPAIAVGQAFDLNAGTRSYPPRWMQRCGLEWLYRLGREPKRLWKRYLLLNPEFVARLALQRDGGELFAEPPSGAMLHG